MSSRIDASGRLLVLTFHAISDTVEGPVGIDRPFFVSGWAVECATMPFPNSRHADRSEQCPADGLQHNAGTRPLQLLSLIGRPEEHKCQNECGETESGEPSTHGGIVAFLRR